MTWQRPGLLVRRYNAMNNFKVDADYLYYGYQAAKSYAAWDYNNRAYESYEEKDALDAYDPYSSVSFACTKLA